MQGHDESAGRPAAPIEASPGHPAQLLGSVEENHVARPQRRKECTEEHLFKTWRLRVQPQVADRVAPFPEVRREILKQGGLPAPCGPTIAARRPSASKRASSSS